MSPSVRRASAWRTWWVGCAVFVAAVSPAWGAAAGDAAAAGPDEDETISLPPLLIEERLRPLRWRYLAIPGREVLSLCDDNVTREFARRVHRLDQLLRLLVPTRFQARWSVPEIQILFNEDLTRARSQEVMQAMLGGEARPSAGSRLEVLPPTRNAPPWGRRRVFFMPNMRLDDVDATAVFAAMREDDENPAAFTFLPDRVRFVLERRIPALPDWFVAGTVGLYERVRLETDSIAVEPAGWVSDAETRALRDDDHRPRELWPMRELLATSRLQAEAKGDAAAVLWRAQCALFVRWAVVEHGGARREALWRFVDRLEQEPLSEDLFRSCFDLGFSDVRDRLSDYLPVAVTQPASVRGTDFEELPALKPREATTAEIGRLRGEWERMQIKFVKRRFPELTEKYVDQARRTLAHAYAEGVRDADLLAVIALTECDAGNVAGARGHLEAAVQSGIARPRVYLELARMRLADVLAEAGEGRLSRAQVGRVLEPLRSLRDMQPPLLEGYALMIELWSRSADVPGASDLAWLNEGVAKFPRVAPLVSHAIHLNATHGALEPALALARAALWAAPDEKTRSGFERVVGELETAAGPP